MLEVINITLSVATLVLVVCLIWINRPQNTNLKNQVVVDTSGLIDGRILDIIKSGFIPQRIIIPKFVVNELQLLADKADHVKRERARYGLEVVRELQDMQDTQVDISNVVAKATTVDAMLVEVAKKTGALLYTTDFNLNQVAQIEGIKVLNVNQLAQNLRTVFLPGETTEIKITQIGQDKTQGVGYLEDGTMVVVERASRMIGQKVAVEFSRVLQTQAGKMMFASLKGQQPQDRKSHRSH